MACAIRTIRSIIDREAWATGIGFWSKGRPGQKNVLVSLSKVFPFCGVYTTHWPRASSFRFNFYIFVNHRHNFSIYISLMQWQFLSIWFVKLWVLCVICTVRVSNLNYSYNIFVCLFVCFGNICSGSFIRFVCICRFVFEFVVRCFYCLCNCAI